MSVKVVPDMALLEPLVTDFGRVIDANGGISDRSGPQIEQALLCCLVQVAIQRGIEPRSFEEWRRNIDGRLEQALQGIWERQPR